MPPVTRLHDILERIRSDSFPSLRAEFVKEVADIEERNVFDDDRTDALKELRSALTIEVEAARGEDSE